MKTYKGNPIVSGDHEDREQAASAAIEEAKRSGTADGDLHVMPEGDLRDHESSCSCWCNPTERSPGVWVHNSMDRREEYEQGRKPS